MGVLQLGFVTIFLSEPLISGYTTGAAMQVFTSQLQHITGLASAISVPNGVFSVPKVSGGRRGRGEMGRERVGEWEGGRGEGEID